MTRWTPFFIAVGTAAEHAVQGLPPERERIAALLDELQVAESAGADALARWAACCQEPTLAALLRVVSARDVDHATLAGARRLELGGPGEPTIAAGLERFCRSLVGDELSDRAKLAMLLARFPSQPRDLFAAELATVRDDDETHGLLDVIAEDERTSLRWLRSVYVTSPDAVLGAAARPHHALADFLDAFVAAESVASEVYQAWASISAAPRLRGGLRAMARREATHARLARTILEGLGERSRRQLDDGTRRTALDYFGRGDRSDADKLDALLARYPSDEIAARWLLVQARAEGDDSGTRLQLEMIAETEVATIAWLRRYRAVS